MNAFSTTAILMNDEKPFVQIMFTHTRTHHRLDRHTYQTARQLLLLFANTIVLRILQQFFDVVQHGSHVLL